MVEIPRPGTRRGLPITLSVGLLTGLSGFLGFWRLSSRSLWLDEAWAVLISDGSWSEMWTTVTQGHAYQAFYYVLLHLWMELFGESEFAVRSLSALFGAATIPVLYLLGRSLFGRAASLAACLVLALSAFFIRYQQEVRGYTVLLFLLTVATYMLVKALRESSVWPWPIYVLTSVLAVYTHLFSLWVLLTHFMVLVFAGANLKRLVLTYGSVALGSSFMFRWLQTREIASPRWMPESPSVTYLIGKLRQLVLYEPVTTIAVAVVLAAGIVMSIFYIARLGRSSWPVLLVLLWATLPIAGTFLGSYVHPMLTARYLIVAFPGLALLAGWSIARLHLSVVGPLVMLVFVGAALPAVISWYSSPGHDWRGAIRHVLRHARPGDGVIAIRSQPWIYYAPRLHEDGFVPDRIVPRKLSQKRIQKYDRIWFLLKKQGSSFAQRLLDASQMTRQRFYDGPPEGWLYGRPIRVRRETGAGRRRAPGGPGALSDCPGSRCLRSNRVTASRLEPGPGKDAA
jgi:mannosyltransferase